MTEKDETTEFVLEVKECLKDVALIFELEEALYDGEKISKIKNSEVLYWQEMM